MQFEVLAFFVLVNLMGTGDGNKKGNYLWLETNFFCSTSPYPRIELIYNVLNRPRRKDYGIVKLIEPPITPVIKFGLQRSMRYP